MKVIIPSYKRCGRVVSLDYAERLTDEILISVQSEADRQDYSAEYGGRAEIVYREATTAAGNRNTLLDVLTAGERALMLDDDVRRLCVCEGPRNADVRDAGRADIDRCFDEMDSQGVELGGFYPVNNPYFAFNRPERTANDILIGAAQLFVGGGLRFDESYKACEDYALVLGIIAGGGRVLRFNRFLVDTTDDSMADALEGKTSGGMADVYASGEHGGAISRLARDYWPIAKLGRGGTSIRIDKRYVS